ncbi:Plasmodium exported protein (PHIST), unknown, putative [Plasmodium sp. gorilla clade G3]|nr:Plasmodium exported protein (PHIST), unknown, putative [Plasmodium sp. gorilla clade G3]
MNKKNCNIHPFHPSDEKKKGQLHYFSLKFLFLCLYMIGFYYVFLNISLENKSLKIAKNCNVYKRNLGEAEKNNKSSKMKKNLKHKKEDVRKTKSNENNIKYNEQKIEDKKYGNNNDMENTKVKNTSNSSVSNINYNDTSKNLTENELCDLLDGLEECPSKEDLRNIWTHTIGVAKEGVDDIQKELKASIQKYLDNDIDDSSGIYTSGIWLYGDIWEEHRSEICATVASEEKEHTNEFYRIINGKHTLDDILKFIYSFLEYFNTLKKELREKHQKELFRRFK